MRMAPAAFGFRSVTIKPMPGPLRYARGRLVHPRGNIDVELRKPAKSLDVKIALPPGVSGTFHYLDEQRDLVAGSHNFVIET